MVIANVSCSANPAEEAITGYNFYLNGAIQGNSPIPSFTIENVPAGTNSFEVSAFNLLGEGPKSDPFILAVPAGGPSKTVNVQVTVSVTVS